MNEITVDDSLDNVIMICGFIVLLNLVSGLVIGFMLTGIVISNALTVALGNSLVKYVTGLYKTGMVYFLCIMIAMARWVDNKIFLQLYNFAPAEE